MYLGKKWHAQFIELLIASNKTVFFFHLAKRKIMNPFSPNRGVRLQSETSHFPGKTLVIPKALNTKHRLVTGSAEWRKPWDAVSWEKIAVKIIFQFIKHV